MSSVIVANHVSLDCIIIKVSDRYSNRDKKVDPVNSLASWALCRKTC